jgi:hypothetical protein
VEEIAMKAVFCLAAAVLTLTSFPLAAQIAANGGGQQSTSASAGSTRVSDSSNGSANGSLGRGHAHAAGAVENSGTVSGPHGAQASTAGMGSGAAAAQMRPVTGELQGNLDAKSAKPGQPVILKTTRKMRTADGTELPKGTRLLGHVTQVESHRKGHSDSELGLDFDRAEMKGGRTIPIHSMIESIQPRPSAMMAESMADEGFAGAGAGMVGAGPVMAGGGGGGRLGGGVLGGGGAMAGGAMAGGAMGGVAGAGTRLGEGAGMAADGTVDNARRVTGDAAGMARGAAGVADRSLYSAAGASGSMAAHATGIPGVLLSGDANGSASGMLSATNRNVHLDSGTQMVLGIAAAAQ